MNGFNVAEAGHLVNILPPQYVTNGVTSQAFNMGKSEHVSILIQIGAVAPTLPTSIQVLATSTGTAGQASPAVGTAIPFRYYLCSGVGSSADLLSPPLVATAAGIPQAQLDKGVSFILIEIDSAEINFLGDSDGADFPYLNLVINNGPNATLMSAAAIMSGVRWQYQGGQSATS